MLTLEADSARGAHHHVSLCEALDRVLNKGAVVVGEVTISVADIDLIYLGLQVVITSIESARRLHTLRADSHIPAGPVDPGMDHGMR